MFDDEFFFFLFCRKPAVRQASVAAPVIVKVGRRHSGHGAAAFELMKDDVVGRASAQRHCLNASDGQRQEDEPEERRK